MELLFTIVVLSLIGSRVVKSNIYSVHNVVLNKQLKWAHTSGSSFAIYCYSGEEKNMYAIWKTLFFRLDITQDTYKVFLGNSAEEVESKYKETLESWFQLLPWHSEKTNIPVFNKSCVGISSEENYTISFEGRKIDFRKVSLIVAGLVLFFFAADLSRNSFFHYSSGITLGIAASLLIVVFVIGRLVPKKAGALSVIFGGWAVVLFFLQKMYSNLKTVVSSYQNYIAGYIVIIGTLSFAVCYRYGPVQDHRTLNLIKWTLQAIGLLLIYSSSEWQELSMSLVLVVFVIHLFPNYWLNKLKIYWKRRFPPKLKLLTEEEYHQQASKETLKSLEELRKYCNSPDCQTWKLITKLNTPVRFAEFIQGASHLSDDEVLEYETSEFKIEESEDDEEFV